MARSKLAKGWKAMTDFSKHKDLRQATADEGNEDDTVQAAKPPARQDLNLNSYRLPTPESDEEDHLEGFDGISARNKRKKGTPIAISPEAVPRKSAYDDPDWRKRDVQKSIPSAVEQTARTPYRHPNHRDGSSRLSNYSFRDRQTPLSGNAEPHVKGSQQRHDEQRSQHGGSSRLSSHSKHLKVGQRGVKMAMIDEEGHDERSTKANHIRFDDQLPGTIYWHEQDYQITRPKTKKEKLISTEADGRTKNVRKGGYWVTLYKNGNHVVEVPITTKGGKGKDAIIPDYYWSYMSIGTRAMIDDPEFAKNKVPGSEVLIVGGLTGDSGFDSLHAVVDWTARNQRRVDCKELRKVGWLEDESFAQLVEVSGKIHGKEGIEQIKAAEKATAEKEAVREAQFAALQEENHRLKEKNDRLEQENSRLKAIVEESGKA